MKRIDLTDQELQALAAFIVAGAGRDVQTVHNASHLLRKLEAAQEVEQPVDDERTSND